MITFKLVERSNDIPDGEPNSAYLKIDHWNDYSYVTMFNLYVYDEDGVKHDIGLVKIGFVRQDTSKSTYKTLDKSFDCLPNDYFSLGQDENYYETLKSLGDEIRTRVLTGLRDIAFNAKLWDGVKNEDVMGVSLLRSVSSRTVTGQFRRMARGDARVTSYDFTYSLPKRFESEGEGTRLDFNVDPYSKIPTNVHVLIGRNGVGKTRFLSLMTKALVTKSSVAAQSGNFEFSDDSAEEGTFANVVAVSFSAFDNSELLANQEANKHSIGFSYIGLRDGKKSKSPNKLAQEFVESLKVCSIGSRKQRWKESISILENDPIFRNVGLNNIIDLVTNDEKSIKDLFEKLSSGHKIVLLTLTSLIEKVAEKTLVLIDEPEGHLHPPLLSALIRAISSLMVKRNGVAIIATHSPVLLQEVPKSCVWILDRKSASAATKAERPPIETFAESVGILSRVVFNLELSQSGYHQVLNDLQNKFDTYEEALDAVNSKLGAEGKAVLRSLYLNAEA
jgi:predicted ATPase